MPARLSVAAQAVLGVTIGALVQPATLGRLGGQWVAVVAVSIGTLAVSMAAGAVMGRRRGISAADRDAGPHRRRRQRADRDQP